MHSLDVRWQFVLETPFHSAGNRIAIGVDRALIRDAEGLPILPATAVKGVLREAVETALRSWGIPTCFSPSPSEMCSDPARLCLVCQIFGNPRSPSPLRFFDARPIRDDEELARQSTHHRTHVALSRHRRSALEHRLFTLETLWPEGIRWEARITGQLADRDKAKMAASLLALGAHIVHAIGGHRTRGLGWLRSRTLRILVDGSPLPDNDLRRLWESLSGGSRDRSIHDLAAPETQEPAPDRPSQG